MNKIAFILYATALTTSSMWADVAKLYDSEQYQMCYTLSKTDVEKDSTDENANFYYGVCAFHLGFFKESIEALERVLIINDNQQRARLELARAYMAVKMYELATQELNIVLQSNPPENVRKNIEKFMEYIKQQSKENSWNLVANISSGYDTNINYSQTKEVLEATYNGASNGELNAYFLNESLALTHQYKPRSNDALTWQNSFAFVNQHHFEDGNQEDVDKYDYQFLRFTTTPMYLYKNTKFAPNIFVSRLNYGGESLLYTYGVKPEISYILHPNIIVDSSLQYFQKKYFDATDFGKELEHFDISIGFNYLVGESGFFVKYSLIEENKKYASNEDFIDKDGFALNGGMQFKIQDYSGAVSFGFSKSNYADAITTINQKREDTTKFVYATINKSIDENFDIGLTFSKQNNDSNYIPNAYDKYTTGFALTYKTRGLF